MVILLAELRINKNNSKVLMEMKVISTSGISKRILENIDFRNLGLGIIILDRRGSHERARTNKNTQNRNRRINGDKHNGNITGVLQPALDTIKRTKFVFGKTKTFSLNVLNMCTSNRH